MRYSDNNLCNGCLHEQNHHECKPCSSCMQWVDGYLTATNYENKNIVSIGGTKTMKKSTFTGYYIWGRIQQLSNEMNEISKAMDSISSASVAHRILKRDYEQKKNEWEKLKEQTYTLD